MSLKTIQPLVLVAVLALSGCSYFQFPGVYKVNVQQGNIITQEMVDQLKPGMTKSQVRYVMGTPLIADTFHQDRWDYFYSLKRGNGDEIRERLIILFDNGVLTGFKGDFIPSSEVSPEEKKPTGRLEEAMDKGLLDEDIPEPANEPE